MNGEQAIGWAARSIFFRTLKGDVMTPARFDVVFRGKLLPGFAMRDVKPKLMKLCSISEEKAVKILKTGRITLRKNVDEITAKKYETALKRIGLDVTLDDIKNDPGYPKGMRKPPAEGPVQKRNAKPGNMTLTGHVSPGSDAGTRQASQPEGDGVSRVPFEFTGSGSEYFKIWLVNVILSFITIGIYSAWAKVRRKQYFYGNTKILESGFQYLADPVKILKGRLVVVGFFIFYSVFSRLLPIVSGIVKTTNLLFRTSSLSHHRFEAGLKTGEYTMLVLTNSLGVALTLGVFFPFAKVRTARYRLQHLALLASGDVEGFIDDGQEKVSAIGEEAGDFFDMDFGL
jgi:hypothetical protein